MFSCLPHSEMSLGFSGSITRLDTVISLHRSKLRSDYWSYFLPAFKVGIKSLI